MSVSNSYLYLYLTKRSYKWVYLLCPVGYSCVANINPVLRNKNYRTIPAILFKCKINRTKRNDDGGK